MVVHLYHPRHRKGVENYTHSLVSELLGLGQEVTVVTTEDRPSYPNYGVRRIRVGEHRVIEVTNNKAYLDFSETYRNPRISDLFREILDEVAPDVVHFQHLLFFASDLVSITKERGIPAVYTLHEFWLQCLRHGHRLLPDGSLCREVSETACARCLEKTRLYNGGTARWAMGALQTVRRFTGVDLHPWVRRTRVTLSRLRNRGGSSETMGGRGPSEVREADPRDESLRRVRDRNRTLLAHLGEMDLFLSPSRFLRREMVGFGLDPEKVIVSDYGFPPSGAQPQTRPLESRGVESIGFIGNLQRHKGLHVVVDAFHRLKDREGQGLRLRVHGNPEHDPAYVSRMRALDSRVEFCGEFQPHERGRVLEGLDLLVFPSIWYENSPLTIHEAHQAGIPVIASDLGGMAELVEPEVNGLLFPPGDSEALGRCLERVVGDRDLCRRLSEGALRTEIKSVGEDARRHVVLYESLRSGEEVSGR